jgi:uncharacterized coiled-coil protein SlyX
MLPAMTDAHAGSGPEPVGLVERVQALEALVAQQARVISELQAENQRLRHEVAELWRRLGQTSATSHRPPSSGWAAQAAEAGVSARGGQAPARQTARRSWGGVDAGRRTP